MKYSTYIYIFFFQAEDGIRDHCVTGVQTCALPILEPVFDLVPQGRLPQRPLHPLRHVAFGRQPVQPRAVGHVVEDGLGEGVRDRKSTRLNSSHTVISYAVFCLKKKKQTIQRQTAESKQT